MAIRILPNTSVTSCPNCQAPMRRIRRKRIDKLLNQIFLGLGWQARYKCLTCLHEMTGKTDSENAR